MYTYISMYVTVSKEEMFIAWGYIKSERRSTY